MRGEADHELERTRTERVREEKDIDRAWQYAQEGGRAGAGKVIVEGFVDFDYEITQLTVRHIGGTSFLEPVGHVQVDGDYRESWQPQAMSLPLKRKPVRSPVRSPSFRRTWYFRRGIIH